MNGIVPDINFQGQMRVLMRILEGDEWRDVWQSLNLAIITFEDLGLAETASDREIWTVCQKTQVILVTGNRTRMARSPLNRPFRTAILHKVCPSSRWGIPNGFCRAGSTPRESCVASSNS